MTGLVASVRGKIDPECLASGKLIKDGCRISMKGVPIQHLVINFDDKAWQKRQDQTSCDYLFFADCDEGSDWVVPLELKRGHLPAGKVISQLQAGARFAENIVPSNKQVRFRPIAAFNGISKADRNKLKIKNSRIRFHGHTESVRLIKCGAELKDVLGP